MRQQVYLERGLASPAAEPSADLEAKRAAEAAAEGEKLFANFAHRPKVVSRETGGKSQNVRGLDTVSGGFGKKGTPDSGGKDKSVDPNTLLAPRATPEDDDTDAPPTRTGKPKTPDTGSAAQAEPKKKRPSPRKKRLAVEITPEEVAKRKQQERLVRERDEQKRREALAKELAEQKRQAEDFVDRYKDITELLGQVVYAAGNLSASGNPKEARMGRYVLEYAQKLLQESKPGGVLLSTIPYNEEAAGEMTLIMREMAGMPKEDVQDLRIKVQRSRAWQTAQREAAPKTTMIDVDKPTDLERMRRDAQVIPVLETSVNGPAVSGKRKGAGTENKPAGLISIEETAKRAKEIASADLEAFEPYMISGEADTLRQALGWEHIPQEISHKDQDSMRLFERMGTALENFSLPEETGMGNLDVVLLTLESSGYPVFLKKFFGGKEPVNTYTYTKAYETSDAKKLGRMQDAIREAIRAYWQDKLVELNKSRLMPVKRAENRKVS